MGNDVCRGLLEFSEGKRLGKRGLYWLKIHLANKLGHDKISFEDRITLVENMLPKIKETIDDPLKHDWWLNEEDCWQALGIMQELNEAHKLENPEDFIR
jgi:DNA-directed RNA polymerase